MLFGHGGDVYSLSRELAIDPTDVLDFSSNCSPLPYPQGLKRYLCENIDQLHLLPEVDSYSVRERLSDRYGLSPDCFLLGNGTTQWIYSLPRILGAKRAFIPLPTYSDYRDACIASGLDVEYLGPYPDGSQDSTDRIMDELSSLKADKLKDSVVFVCNPNNPTGLFIPPMSLLEIIETRQVGTWIIDEAYAPFVSDDSKSSLLSVSERLPPNIIILRSFSKIYGIPGLRIGCLVTTGKVLGRLHSRERPWAVNRMAQLAADFLLRRPDFELKVRQYCQDEKQRIISGLSNIKAIVPMNGVTHFTLFEIHEPLSAKIIYERLKIRGMLIRNCNNFSGLRGEYIRISPRMTTDNIALITAMEGVCAQDS